MQRFLRPRILLVIAAVLLAASLSVRGCGTSTEPDAGSTPAANGATQNPHSVALEKGFTAGLERARREGKPLLLLFTFQGCTYCRELKKSVLPDPQVVSLSRQFVCAEVDLDQEGDVCKHYRIRGYPTVLLTDPQGKDLLRLTGVKPASVLASEMESALRTLHQYTAAARRNEIR